MRDIRKDLQDRAQILEDEINAAQVQFDKKVEQLKVERDTRIEEIRDEIAALNRLIEAEKRRIDQATPQAPAAVALSPGQQALVDFVLRTLSEHGPMSVETLRDWSMREGFFTEPDSATRGMQAVLMATVKSGRIRQLPNGTFASALLMDQLRQRQAI
ncbi:hypothetical protein V6C03_04530 [Methyloligella sp. 2.7D]|uniref:hypothetical protein n=1 Tax=unclassified Methyloligella TaxID=2625955 RepID=UPI00157DBD0E|nr:hypothetical protein [Methyloligella sp. GL2]QKP76137.1 hypothetical protein HT051_00900 [Methyloligella sp. GL2]